MSVFAHVYPTTRIQARVVSKEKRAVIKLEGAGAMDVALFLPRSEVERLRDILAETAAELDAPEVIAS
jgi:hypothetical protein